MALPSGPETSPAPSSQGAVPLGDHAELADLVRLGRPLQWTKNLVVLAALVFSGQISHWGPVTASLRAFVAFCLMSSAVYAVNDILDANEDRAHPVKRNRPIASGKVSTRAGWWFAAVMATGGLTIGLTTSLALGLVCLSYGCINLAYSRWVKHIVILDVMLVSSGFVLRAVAGAVASRVAVSPWLLVCTILLSLFLAMCKRRYELVALDSGGGAHRRVLSSYSVPLLDQMISSTTAATIMAYCMYAFSSPTAHNAPYLMLTIPFVIYGVFRYLYLVYRMGEGGEPERIFISDRPLQLNMLLWIVASGLIVFLGR